MSELDDFLTNTIKRQIKAEEAIHNGDPLPRLEMWSTKDPVTLFGAWGPTALGMSSPSIRVPLPRHRRYRLYILRKNDIS